MPEEIDPVIDLTGDAPIKRGPGRPKGSKNRPRETVKTSEKLQELFNRFEPYLTTEQKKYVKGVIAGEQDLDCFYEMELLVRQMSLLFQESATWFFGQGKVSQDLAKFADGLRMAIKDLHDMQTKREDAQAKKSSDDGLVLTTSERPEMARLTEILAGHSP